MVERVITEESGGFWATAKERYRLVKIGPDGDDTVLALVDIRDFSGVTIDNEELDREVIRLMKSAGVPVITVSEILDMMPQSESQ